MLTRTTIVTLITLAFALTIRAADNKPPEGFKPLFNGDNLNGWKADDVQKKHWTVKEGVLDLNPVGAPSGKDITLWSQDEFGDVTIMLDWRWSGPAQKKHQPILLPSGDEKKDETGKIVTVEIEERDSGVYLRGSSKSQVNIWAWPAGSGEVYGYRTDRKMPAEVRAGVTPKKNMDKPVGEWNHMVITIKGDRLTVAMNGEEVITNAQLPGIPQKGPIALQNHGQAIQFKNIYVKELK